jgi:hypothetical protein
LSLWYLSQWHFLWTCLQVLSWMIEIQIKFGTFYIPIIVYWNLIMDNWKMDEKAPIKLLYLQHYNTKYIFNKKRHQMLSLHLVYTGGLQSILTKQNRIDNTKHNA